MKYTLRIAVVIGGVREVIDFIVVEKLHENGVKPHPAYLCLEEIKIE